MPKKTVKSRTQGRRKKRLKNAYWLDMTDSNKVSILNKSSPTEWWWWVYTEYERLNMGSIVDTQYTSITLIYPEPKFFEKDNL